MNDTLTLFIIAGALFVVAIAAVGRADAQGKAAKNFHLNARDKVHHELAENGWEIVAVVSIAIAITLAVVGTAFAFIN